MRTTVQRQVTEAITKLEGKLITKGPGVSRYLTLPAQGWTDQQIHAELIKLSEMEHTRWEDGLVSGAVYHGGNHLVKLQAEAFERFSVANPIHPDVFPGVRKMEAEIVAMVLAMFNAPSGGAGVTTSGGTESILMACLSARQKAYAERGVTEPEMYVSIEYIYREHVLMPLSGSCQKQRTLRFAKQARISISKSTLSLARPQHTESMCHQSLVS